MKWLAHICLLLICHLTWQSAQLPVECLGTPGDGCVDRSGLVMEFSQADHEDHHSGCAPDCSCRCCATVFMTNQLAGLQAALPIIQTNLPAPPALILSDIEGGVWQPPKLLSFRS